MELQPADIILHQPQSDNTAFTGELQFSKITVPDDYLKKWNEHLTDFIGLTRNGQLLRNTLYRVGGMSANPKNDYFMLIKHIESVHSSTEPILLKYNGQRYLKSVWCIVDKNGVEKVVFKDYSHGYLVKDSCLYTIDNKYYNIETGEFYCSAFKSIETKKFLFLDNAYDNDHGKRGVMKINKADGTWELFPE